jgi:hypothetical protein
MVNYQLGKIYKIVCNTTGNIYVGSTCQPTLARRLSKHVGDYKSYLNKNKHFMTSYAIIKNNDYNIILLEAFPCNSKDELHARERYYIENIECVNKNIPTRSFKEYYDANKERISKTCKNYYETNKINILDKTKKYHETNKESISKQRKNYYETNKINILEKNKDYREKNKEHISEKIKEYYETNKEKIKEYYETNKEKIKDRKCILLTCECGRTIRKTEKARHLKSLIHKISLEKSI